MSVRDDIITALLNQESLRRAQAGDDSPFVAPDSIKDVPADAPSPQRRSRDPNRSPSGRRPVVTTRTILQSEPAPNAPPVPPRRPQPQEQPAPQRSSWLDMSAHADEAQSSPYTTLPDPPSVRLPPWIAAHPGHGRRWEYSQSTGQLSYGGVPFGEPGYSGAGNGRNNPAMQAVQNVGPIPQGDYRMGETGDYAWNGRSHPAATPLIPASTNSMYDRDGFLIHGGPRYDASQGCIILDDGTRVYLGRSQNRDLRVTA